MSRLGPSTRAQRSVAKELDARAAGASVRAFHDLSSLSLAGRDGSAAAPGSSSEEVLG